MDENDIIERRTCISGVGQSDIGRRLFRDPLELTLDGCLAAIEHAGLTTADIDGVSTYPGPMGTPAGFSGAGAYDVMDALRLKCGWYGSGLETSGQLGSVDQRVPRGRVRAREPRAVLPLGLRRLRAGRQGPLRGHARWRRRRGRRRVQGVGLHGVEPAVLARRRPRSGSRCSPSATSTSTARRASSSRGSR